MIPARNILCLSLLAVALASPASFAKEAMKPINEVFEPNPADYPKDKWVKVAAVSYNPGTDAPLTDNQRIVDRYKAEVRDELEARIVEAANKGAELVVTPEFGLIGYPDAPELPPEQDNFRNKDDIRPYAETLKGKSVKHFAALAKRLGIYLVIGLAEDGGGDKFYNTAVMIGSNGKVIARYRKANLFEIETNYLDKGDEAVVFDTELFGRTSMIICSDVYAPFPGDEMVRKGSEVTLLPTSWAESNTGFKYFTDYAVKNRQYFVAANQNYFPDTGIINPDGTAQSHIRQTAGTAYGYIPRKNSRR